MHRLPKKGSAAAASGKLRPGEAELFRFDQFHLAVKATIESEICRQWSDPLGKCIVYLDRDRLPPSRQNICDLQAKGGVAPLM